MDPYDTLLNLLDAVEADDTEGVQTFADYLCRRVDMGGSKPKVSSALADMLIQAMPSLKNYIDIKDLAPRR